MLSSSETRTIMGNFPTAMRALIKKAINENPINDGETLTRYTERVKGIADSYMDEDEPEAVEEPVVRKKRAAPTPAAEQDNEQPEGPSLQYSSEPGDILSDGELTEKPYLFATNYYAVNSMRNDLGLIEYRKNALWTMIFALLRFVPTTSRYYGFEPNLTRVEQSTLTETDRRKTFFEYNTTHTANKNYEDNTYLQRYIYYMTKISFYGVISVCKQVTDLNRSFLQKRWDAFKASTGISDVSGVSPLADVDSMTELFKGLYNSNVWAVKVREMIIRNKSKIPNDFSSLHKLYDICMMLMKNYGQKHLMMPDYLIKSKTHCLLIKEIQDQINKLRREVDEILNDNSSGIDLEYFASLNILPNSLQQSNYLDVIAAYMILNPNGKYKNKIQPSIPIDELTELCKKKIVSTYQVDDSTLRFLNDNGISGEIIEEEFKYEKDKLLLKKLKMRNNLKAESKGRKRKAGDDSDSENEEPSSSKRK